MLNMSLESDKKVLNEHMQFRQCFNTHLLVVDRDIHCVSKKLPTL